MWHSHADYHNGTTLLAPEDLLTDLLKPYDVGAQGVIMWGSASELNNTAFIEVGCCHEAFITVCNMHGIFLAAQSYQPKLLLNYTLKNKDTWLIRTLDGVATSCTCVLLPPKIKTPHYS